MAIVEHDRVVLARGFGVRDIGSGAPVDSQTVFPIGSCTKAFTAMAAVISQEQGRLSLDDSPRRYLPWFRLQDSEANALVTIRDLLSHRTGLRAYADLAAEPGVLTREQYLKAAMGARPVARLREKFQYSNAMMVAAGEIVGKVQKTTWEEAIQRLLFVPLGMRSSIASLASLPRMANHVVGYDDPTHSGKWRAVGPPASLNALAPAGAIGSSAADMTRWIRFMLNEGTLDGRRVASAEGVREVTTPHNQINRAWSYGLGWGLYDWNGHHVVEHNGGSQGISAVVSMVPERGVGFVILMNASPNSLNTFTQAGKILWPILLGEAAREGAPPTAAHAAARTAVAAPAAIADSSWADTTGLPDAKDLLAKMLQAAGGKQNLTAHTSFEMRLRRRYVHQGVDAEQRVRWQAPDRREDHETWTAAGRRIGEVRVYTDGTHGAQETTFGQDEVYSGDALWDVKRDAAATWLLQPRRLFPRIEVRGRFHRRPDNVLQVAATPQAGQPETLLVSERTSLIVERKRGSTTEAYSDFHNVDGWVVPFGRVIQDELGESEIMVETVRFDRPVPGPAFEPHKQPEAPQSSLLSAPGRGKLPGDGRLPPESHRTPRNYR